MSSDLKFIIQFLFVLFLLTACKKDITPQITTQGPPPLFNQPCKITGYYLDTTLIGKFEFIQNFSFDDPWYDTGYYDVTSIKAKVIIPPMGEFNFYISEFVDTADLSDKIIWSTIDIIQESNNPIFIIGNCAFYFKKLIRQGGGSFDGTSTFFAGSALDCDQELFNNLTPLTLKGNLDLASGIVKLTINGRVWF